MFQPPSSPLSSVRVDAVPILVERATAWQILVPTLYFQRKRNATAWVERKATWNKIFSFVILIKTVGMIQAQPSERTISDPLPYRSGTVYIWDEWATCSSVKATRVLKLGKTEPRDNISVELWKMDDVREKSTAKKLYRLSAVSKNGHWHNVEGNKLQKTSTITLLLMTQENHG